jgi:hypothetical protein
MRWLHRRDLFRRVELEHREHRAVLEPHTAAQRAPCWRPVASREDAAARARRESLRRAGERERTWDAPGRYTGAIAKSAHFESLVFFDPLDRALDVVITNAKRRTIESIPSC